MMISRFASLLLVLAAAWQGAAHAHLMPAGQGGVRIDSDSVFAVVSIPVSALKGFDDDGDGRMSLAEMNRHRDSLLAQSAGVLDFRSDGQPAALAYQDLLIPHLHEPGASAATDEVIAMQRWRWPEPIASLALRVTTLEQGGAPIALRASDGARTETVMLTSHYAEHRFFEGPLATLMRHVALGAEHILLGADHLLFLLTVLVVGAGWRYWLAVVTSFTLAHSATLTLAALGWVRVVPAIAEPLIAASIVLVAVDNLLSRHVGLRRRAAMVFACGLVHGLGFATALQEIGGTGPGWLTLGGFNLGVEAGQILFVAAAVCVVRLLRTLPALADGARLVRIASIAAALGGLALFTRLVAA